MNNTLDVRQDVVIPEPENVPAFLLQEGSSTNVARTLYVLTAVGLDDQPVPGTSQINDEWANRVLTSEAVTGKAPVAERAP